MAKMFGLIGETLGHSFSPMIHRLVYEATGWQAEYGIFQVERNHLNETIPALKTLGIEGANVTIPYKQAVMSFLDEITPEATSIGAVNTVLFQGGKTIGDNTDYYGIVKTFEKMGISLNGKTAVILGNGGASKAVQAVLRDEKADFEIFSIEDDGNPDFSALSTVTERDILINATPVGMHPKGGETPIEKAILAKFSYVFDLVYNPMPTRLIRESEERGLGTSTGLSMLVYQAIRSDELWFGENIPDEKKEEILQKVFAIVKGERA